MTLQANRRYYLLYVEGVIEAHAIYPARYPKTTEQDFRLSASQRRNRPYVYIAEFRVVQHHRGGDRTVFFLHGQC